MYTVSSKYDEISGEKFWYCHKKEFPNIPVFGSIGSWQKANAIKKQMNASVGK